MTMLVFKLGDGKEVEFDLSAEVVTLGRARDNDIVIQNQWISSHHARFERIGDKVGLIDLQSHNGILLNGHRVTVAALKSGDILTFGQLEAVFREVPEAPAAGPAAAGPAVRTAATVPPPLPPEPEPAAAKPSPVRPVPLVPPRHALPVPEPRPAPASLQPATARGTPPGAGSEPATSKPPADGDWMQIHDFAKALIKRLDLLDALLANVAERDPATAAQLQPLRSSLVELLREYSVEPYTVEVGKALDVATRKRIQIVEPTRDPEGATEIAEVFRPGYVCHNGPGGTPTVLRKAEVRTARPAISR